MRLYQSRPGHPERARWHARLVHRIRRFSAAPVPPRALDLLARTSLEIGEPALSAQIALKAAASGGIEAADRYQQAGLALLAAGDPAGAAEAFRQAGLHSPDPRRTSELGLRTVDALLAAQRQRDALDELRLLVARAPNDLRLLDRSFALALALGQTAEANQYAERRAALAPNDVARQSDRRRLEVAMGRPAEALAAALAIVARHPEDAAERRQLAELAEWAGDLGLALDNWCWLAERGVPGAVERGLRVARAGYDWARVRELQQRQRHGEQLDYLALVDAVRTDEELGQPEEAAELVAHEGDLSDRRVWELLADLHERSGHIDEALAALRAIVARFGRSLALALKQADLLCELGEPEQATAVLAEAADLAGPADERYQRKRGELAWSQGSVRDGVAAYRALLEAGTATNDEIYRLLILMEEGGQRRELVQVARKVWGRVQDPAMLAMAMQSAQEADDWDGLAAILTFADARPELFRDRELYWLSRARLALARHQPEQAEDGFAHALGVNPDSRQARLSWLWMALDRDDRPRLAQLTAAWADMARLQPEYWQPYAAALDRLGRLREALPFYGRAARAVPTDLPFLEQYADALERAGQVDGSRRLYQFVLEQRARQTRPAITVGDGPGPRVDPGALVSYARLLRRREGDGATAPLTRMLAARHAERPDVERLGYEVAMADQDLPGVRRWLDGLGRTGAARPVDRAALALAEDDRETLARLLKEDPGSLSRTDRVTIGRRLGRHALVSRLLAEGLAAPASESERADLTEQLRQITEASAAWVKAEAGVADRGPVEVAEERVSASAPWGDWRLSVHAAHLRLSPQDATLWTSAGESRGDLAVGAALERPQLRLALSVGARPGPDRLAPYAAAEASAGLLDPWSHLELAAALHETPTEGLLLALGRRDRVEARLRLEWGREYALLGGQLRRDSDRAGEWLGNSELGTLELGTRLSLIPELRFFTQGTIAHATLAGAVPRSLQGVLGPRAGLGLLLAPHWASLVGGASLASGPAAGTRLRYSLDATTGWLEPAGTLVFRVEASAGFRLLSHQVLALRTFMARGQGGRAAETERGFLVSYELDRD
jgi:tetratricopeptide (TPR) repeat protein